MSVGLYVFWLVAVTLYAGPADDGSATWRRPHADPSIDGPGTLCPWPFEPLQMIGLPLGQYHCGYCSSMVLAGVPHVDYRDL